MNETVMEQSPLIQSNFKEQSYNPSLLYPIPRHYNRSKINISHSLPFSGGDMWNAYEFSWLNQRGKPQIAMLEIYVPCQSQNIIESKSLKLYFNSFANSRFDSIEHVEKVLVEDLSNAAEAEVSVSLITYDTFSELKLSRFPGVCIDSEDIAVDFYQCTPKILRTDDNLVEETLVSHLLKSNCPVTEQPDWASVLIHYKGPQIDKSALLRYIISFRQHREFHEQCVERIYMDLIKHCHTTHLTVYARYTRRGGIDINPFRSNFETLYPNWRLPRQ